MTSLFYDTFTTPLGDFSVAIDAAGSIVATAFGDLAALQDRLRPPRPRAMVRRGVLAEPPKSPAHRDGSAAPSLTRNSVALATVRAQVGEYFAGERRAFDLPLAPAGSAFQRRVWAALGTIPFGATRSYAQLAAALGSSNGARAVGGANAANPICLLVPCHRVIGSDGSLTGFAFGEERKRALLEHERAVCARTATEPLRLSSRVA